jgi:hypothetical protein
MSGRSTVLPVRAGRAPLPRGSAVGGLAWAVGVLALRPGWAEAMLLLASFAVVPLGLELAVSADPRSRSMPLRMAARLHWPAALALTASFAVPAGGLGIMLALPWLVTTVLAALHGLRSLWRGPRTTPEVCLDVGLIYLAVGGAWTVIARAGMRPLGFPDLIVLLTAVHFHYAGFALPVLAGLAARALGGPVAGAACLGVIAGVPLVAIGITDAQLSPGILPPRLLELVASAITAASSILVGLLQIRLAWRSGSPILARALMATSGLALLGPMALAALYALGSFEGVARIEIATMLRYHGAVNALGFAVPGLLSWHLQPSGWGAADA